MASTTSERGLIVVFGSEKGGAGKSTCAINVAVELARREYTVLIIDADRQRTSAKWAERREQELTAKEDPPTVQCIEKLGKNKKYSPGNGKALRRSDC